MYKKIHKNWLYNIVNIKNWKMLLKNYADDIKIFDKIFLIRYKNINFWDSWTLYNEKLKKIKIEKEKWNISMDSRMIWNIIVIKFYQS